MSKITMRKRNRTHLHLPDGAPRALANGADEAVSRVREVAEEAGGRVAGTASRAGDEFSELAGKAGERANELVHRGKDTTDRARRELADTRRKRRRLVRRSRRAALQTASTVVDRQLAKQISDMRSQLAEQSAEIGRAVGTLDEVMEAATRKPKSHRRSTLIIGLGLGAAIMYHFDPERGRERRAETANLVNSTTARFVNQTAGDHEV
jgi:polyhydroxyalkanoate synthesis regulator phasin